MLKLGFAQGISIENDWANDINRLSQNYYMVEQAKQMREQKIKQMAEDSRQGHGSNPYINGRLQTYYEQLNNELSSFIIDNPGFEEDLSLRKKYNDITGKFLNNDLLREDKLVAQEFQKLVANQANMTELQFENEYNKYKAYINQNSDGSEGISPYIYSNPKIITTNDVIAEGTKLLGTLTSTYLKQKDGERLWYRSKAPTTNDLNNVVNGLMNNPEYEFAINRDFEKINKYRPGLYNSAHDYAVELLRSSKSRSYELLGGDKRFGMGTGNQPSSVFNRYTVLEKDLYNAPNISRNDEYVIKENASEGLGALINVDENGYIPKISYKGFRNGRNFKKEITPVKILNENGSLDFSMIPGNVKVIGEPEMIRLEGPTDGIKLKYLPVNVEIQGTADIEAWLNTKVNGVERRENWELKKGSSDYWEEQLMQALGDEKPMNVYQAQIYLPESGSKWFDYAEQWVNTSDKGSLMMQGSQIYGEPSSVYAEEYNAQQMEALKEMNPVLFDIENEGINEEPKKEGPSKLAKAILPSLFNY